MASMEPMNSVAMKVCDVETNTVIPQFQIGTITSKKSAWGTANQTHGAEKPRLPICNIGSSLSQEQLEDFEKGFRFLGDEYALLQMASETHKISMGLISKNKSDAKMALLRMG